VANAQHVTFEKKKNPKTQTNPAKKKGKRK
jgi:hypothetical protein